MSNASTEVAAAPQLKAKFICFVEQEGFVQCTNNGEYIGTTLTSANASELDSKQARIEWISQHPSFRYSCAIMTRIPIQ